MWKIKPGFSLMELVITIGLAAALSAAGMSLIGQGPRRAARDNKRQADLETIRSAAEFYRGEVGSYPLNTSQLTAQYMPNPPSDPKSGAAYVLAGKPTGCNGTTNICTSYIICSTLEKVTAVDGVCTSNGISSCGSSTCSYHVNNP